MEVGPALACAVKVVVQNQSNVDDGTNNETLRQLFRTRSLASHTQVLSEPCNKVSPSPLPPFGSGKYPNYDIIFVLKGYHSFGLLEESGDRERFVGFPVPLSESRTTGRF
jgi:hypothetical protein